MGFSVLGFSIPVFVLGYILIWLVSLKLGWLPVQGYQRIADGLRAVPPASDPALDHALGDLHRADRARDARRGVEALGEDYIRTARAKGLPELRVLMRHALANAAVPIVTVIGIGVALLIGGVVVTEIGVRDPRPRPAHRGCGAGARFPDHPGRDPVLLVRLRADQPAGGPVATCSSIRGSATDEPRPQLERRSAWSRRRRWRAASARGRQRRAARSNWSVRIGGAVLRAARAVVALAAPWLGTVDPTLFDAGSRDLLPGELGEITTSTARRSQHTF